MEKQDTKVIMVGTLSEGFAIHCVTQGNKATEILDRLTGQGRIADALDVQDPLTLDKRAAGVSDEGFHFVVYGKGLGNGFSVYGPFESSDYAEEFGEDNRSEDDEWEIFELAIENRPAKDRYTEILQHRIKFWLHNVGDKLAPEELDDCSTEHITRRIAEGYNQGELCVLGDDGDTEFRGWWSIERDC